MFINPHTNIIYTSEKARVLKRRQDICRGFCVRTAVPVLIKYRYNDRHAFQFDLINSWYSKFASFASWPVYNDSCPDYSNSSEH